MHTDVFKLEVVNRDPPHCRRIHSDRSASPSQPPEKRQVADHRAGRRASDHNAWPARQAARASFPADKDGGSFKNRNWAPAVITAFSEGPLKCVDFDPRPIDKTNSMRSFLARSSRSSMERPVGS